MKDFLFQCLSWSIGMIIGVLVWILLFMAARAAFTFQKHSYCTEKLAIEASNGEIYHLRTPVWECND